MASMTIINIKENKYNPEYYRNIESWITLNQNDEIINSSIDSKFNNLLIKFSKKNETNETIKIVQKLLESDKIDVLKSNIKNFDPLMYAVKKQNQCIIRLLINFIIKSEIDINSYKKFEKGDKFYYMNLFEIMYKNINKSKSFEEYLSCIELMIQIGFHCNMKTVKKKPILHYVVKKANSRSDVHFFNAMIKCGANINIKDTNSCNLIYNMISNSKFSNYYHMEILNMAISYGMDIHKGKSFYYTPLEYALRHNRYEIIKILIQNGVDVNKTTYDFTNLMIFIRDNHNKENFIPIVKLLIEAGININAEFLETQFNTGLNINTALTFAISYISDPSLAEQVIELLMEDDIHFENFQNLKNDLIDIMIKRVKVFKHTILSSKISQILCSEINYDYMLYCERFHSEIYRVNNDDDSYNERCIII